MSNKENHHDEREHRAPDRRHLSLFIAVGAVMAAVVSLWAYFLPSQLKEFRLFSDPGSWPGSGSERLRGAANADDGAVSAQLELLRARLEQEMKPPVSMTEEPTAEDEVRRLREKIEENQRTGEQTN